jgi:predicted  nucleic acid-binding Zn-ribbon protein
MSNELIALAAVGVALIGVILTSSRGLRQDMARLEGRLEGQINGLRGEINGLRGEINELRERMSHLEGLLEGLREAIAGRVSSR